MNDDRKAEFEVMAHANENGKFVVPLGADVGQRKQAALERLLLREWVRLIDVSRVPTSGIEGFVRVFMLTDAARAAYHQKDQS